MTKKIKLIVTTAILALSSTAEASPPMARETVDKIAAAVSACTGGWHIFDGGPSRLIGPTDLLPRLKFLSRPSAELDREAGEDLYKLAHALLTPATGAPSWLLDGVSFLKCPPRPREAVALMEYLVGEGPDEWRGFVNAFDWLGLAYETGVMDAPQPEKARRYYLRSRLHSTYSRHDRWSDGRDRNLIANIERAGLRPYLEALARSERGAAARMILAEEALPSNPAKARRLLLNLDVPSLNRLVALEEEGRVPTIFDAADIAFWAEAWRTLTAYRKWAARLLKGARLANGGAIPTSSRRPSAATLRPNVDDPRLAGTDGTRDPIPVRALVNPEGRAIYVEACRATPRATSTPTDVLNVQLDAARLYDLTKLPSLPTASAEGRPVYTWVILPAVHFQREDGGEVKIRFANLPAERCAHSAMVDTPFSTRH
jgi:hypothetical protein